MWHDWRSYEIRKHQKNPKTWWNYCLMLSPLPKMKILSVLEIELCHIAWFHMKTRVCLKYFVNHYLLKRLLDSKSPHTTSSFICLTIFVNLRPMTQLICNKALKFVLLDNCFSDLFTDVQIWHWKPFEFGPGPFFRKIK